MRFVYTITREYDFTTGEEYGEEVAIDVDDNEILEHIADYVHADYFDKFDRHEFIESFMYFVNSNNFTIFVEALKDIYHDSLYEYYRSIAKRNYHK